MTDWWSTATAEPQRVSHSRIPDPPEEEPARSAPEGVQVDAGPDRHRGRGKSLALGAAGAALAGVVLFVAVPDDRGAERAASGQQEPSRGEYLPPAGDAPSEAVQDQPEAGRVVTLSASPSGSGSVGAVVEVTIVNGTEETLIVMPSMLKGDGRSAVIGEGTLAPGSREVGPGESATGTIEFAAKEAPEQISLMDIGGNVVAVSE